MRYTHTVQKNVKRRLIPVHGEDGSPGRPSAETVQPQTDVVVNDKKSRIDMKLG